VHSGIVDVKLAKRNTGNHSYALSTNRTRKPTGTESDSFLSGFQPESHPFLEENPTGL